MSNTNIPNLPPALINRDATHKASEVTNIGDLLWYDSTNHCFRSAANVTDAGSTTTPENFCTNFVGVSQSQQLSTDATARNCDCIIDSIWYFPCVSNAFQVGDYVKIAYDSVNNVLFNQKLDKTTDALAAIGRVVKEYTSATTTVKVRLTSRLLAGIKPVSATGAGVFDSITGDLSTLSINGLAGSSSAGGAVTTTGGAGSGATNAGGVANLVGGAGGTATTTTGGAGGAISSTGGAGGTATTGTGGAGGAATFTSGAGGNASGAAGIGGASGAAGLVAGATGTATTGTGGAGGTISLTGAAGGAASGAAGIGGAGSAISIVAGAGGATSSATSGISGVGGAITMTAGAGGACAATGAQASAAGGAISITTGASGSVAGSSAAAASGVLTLATGVGGASTSSGNGGAAGALNVTGGAGGASSTGAGGAGSSVTITAGAGGAASAGTGNGGAGGSITLNPGAGGTSSGGTAGAKGNVIIGDANTVATYLNRGALAALQVGVTLTALGTVQSSTPTAAQLLGGLLSQTGATGAGTVTLPSGTALSAACARTPVVGDSFDCAFYNLGGGQTLTITGATGTTVIGTAAVGSGKMSTMKFYNTGANAWNIYVNVSA